MRRTSTLILLLLTIGLGLYIWLRERHELSTAETREALQQVLRFDPEEVTALRWTYRDEHLSAERRGDQWWLLDPYEDRANPELIHAILRMASELTIIETMGGGELRGSESGLGSRAIDLELDLADGRTLAVTVGQAGPYTESVYVRFDPFDDNREIIALADGNLRDPLRIPVGDWRDPVLLDFDPAAVIGLRLQTGSGEMVATRPPEDPDAMWQLERPLQTRGHRSRIDDLLSLLRNLDIRGVVGDYNNHSPGQNGGELTDPELRVILTLAGGGDLDLILGAAETGPEGRIRARAGDRKVDFYLDDPILRLATLQPNDLRDDQLANVNPAVIQGVTIESPTEPPVRLARQGDSWWMITGDLMESANPDRIKSLIQGLNRQPIAEFSSDTAADLAPYGLDQPLRTITLTTRPWSADEAPAAGAGTGAADTVRLRIGQAEDYRIYAHYEGEPFVYQVTAEVLNVMPPHRARWRSLQLLRFSLFHLENLRIQQGLQPPLELTYQADSYQWRAQFGGRDVSALLDRQRVDLLAATLATFQASDWITDRSEAYQALREPSLRLRLVIRGEAAATGEAGERSTAELVFASSAPDRPAAPYYGQLNNHPDVFLIPATLYQRLAAAPFDPDRLRQLRADGAVDPLDNLPPMGDADDLPPLITPEAGDRPVGDQPAGDPAEAP